jgi:hypothetical protein
MSPETPAHAVRRVLFDEAKHCGAHPGDPERGPCRAGKGKGTNHVGWGRCKHHGGNTPAGIAAAQREMQEHTLREAMVTYGLPREIEPSEALLEEIARTAGHIDWLREQIERVGGERVDSLITGPRLVKTVEGPAGRVQITEVAAAVNLWLALYQDERRHLVQVCRTALAAGVEERRVRLAEQQGNLLAQVIRSVLGDLELTPDQWSRVSEVVPRHLRAVASA